MTKRLGPTRITAGELCAFLQILDPVRHDSLKLIVVTQPVRDSGESRTRDPGQWMEKQPVDCKGQKIMVGHTKMLENGILYASAL
jgi:hypothetical protein